ncbi:MAG TPA: ABC transporter permease [Candidatus Scybalocola faecavium]|nr:ABC transporter permease [Candidatus Scybalocola faecavium]
MRGLKVVFNKEMRRVFREPKMIFSLFILPVILMIGIYALIGYLGKNMTQDIEEHKSIVYVENMPEEISGLMGDFMDQSQVTVFDESSDLEAMKALVADGSIDLIVIFPENFMESVESYTEGGEIPDIQVFYNPSEDYSNEAWTRLNTVFDDSIRPALLTQRIGDLKMLDVFTVNASGGGTIIDEQRAAGQILSMMLPYLITILLFAGTMSLGTDTITGEKERGTMASMLVTPVRRSDIVLGKLLALTCMSMLSAAVYIIALVVAMPQTMGTGDLAFSFNASQVLMVIVLMILLAFFYVSLVGLVAVLAKTMKEATTYVSPLYIIVIVAGLFTMLSTSGGHETWEYLIPIYNVALALGEIFTQELTVVHFLLTIGSTLVYSALLSGVIVKAFNSERFMFNA